MVWAVHFTGAQGHASRQDGWMFASISFSISFSTGFVNQFGALTTGKCPTRGGASVTASLPTTCTATFQLDTNTDLPSP